MAATSLRSSRVVLPDRVTPATVHVRDGVIVAITAHAEAPAGVVELGDQLLAPGLVDTHVHINEPGRTDWEGFDTATRAAAAGGVTTVVDMPLNSIPPTCTVAALEEKRSAARGKVFVDTAFWAGAVPGHLGDLGPLHAAGAIGFKAFLCDSGVPEFPAVDPQTLERAVARCAELGALVIVHAEAPGPLAAAAHLGDPLPPRSHAAWLATRPPAAEDVAVRTLVDLCRRHRARMHVVHLSSAGALAELRVARAEGLPLSAETCPHYLALAAEDVPEGATEFKCAPPIRSRANQDLLWQALVAGEIPMIVTDHSPAPADMKCRDTGAFPCAWGGISSVQLGLAVVWDAWAARGGRPQDLSRWMSAAPAALAGLPRKGRIAIGADADLVVWDDAATFTVDPTVLHHRHPLTPYVGRRLRGVVHQTWLRGELVFADGSVVGSPRGTLLTRQE